MKNIQLLSGIALIALAFTSCKDEKQEKAQKTIDSYVAYVDSVKNVKADDLKADWKAVDAEYDKKAQEADLALADIKDNSGATEKVNKSKVKYEEFKKEMTTVVAPPPLPAPSPKQQLRNALFGEGKIGNDMSFAWVNAQNIHSVYQQFVHTVENNKDKYSREDWDEIKLMYEALDSRKNTVEKEGLTSKDNRKIAGLKLKFAPMYTINRMKAKSEENAEAKK
ncbi:hypothetical protein [uncultured Flavobacterium sp.]|uniref:hypothetical protein n=1 Tax=uncultured Flavobacterium sp. TaxID=165435 RepID=UPI00292F3230|nr:hypothetical protein [uncultured Flavobacterium sp.]